MTVTEVDYGSEFRWWENQETLYAVADFLVDNYDANGRTIITFFKTPWLFSPMYEEWFAGQIETMTDPN